MFMHMSNGVTEQWGTERQSASDSLLYADDSEDLPQQFSIDSRKAQFLMIL